MYFYILVYNIISTNELTDGRTPRNFKNINNKHNIFYTCKTTYECRK